jgi:hypothetical protein
VRGCPHEDALHVDGECYIDIKVKGGLIGHAGDPSALTPDQRGFVGIPEPTPPRGGWREIDVDEWADHPVTAYERKLEWGKREDWMYRLRPETAQEIADGGSR